ncbi:MAG: hypothetical protein ACO3A2_09110 [Bdellovibrionia bacterium]
MDQIQKSRNQIWESWWTFFISVAFVGPFALPLLWRNPRQSKKTKVVVSFLVIALTLVLLLGGAWVMEQLNQKLQALQLQNSNS